MQLQQFALFTLLVATFSLAADAPAARDIAIEGETVEKRTFIEERSPKKGSSGGDYGTTGEAEGSAASFVSINAILAAGAGAIAVGAMML